MSMVLEIKNLSKNYGNIQALKNVSFSVPGGTVYGILGPNGSGKTTIGKTLVSKLTQKGIPIEYRHEYDYVFIKYLFKLLGNKRVEKES